MAQTNLFLNEKEEEKISKYKKKWNLSKYNTIKKMILEFKEVSCQTKITSSPKNSKELKGGGLKSE